MCQCSIFKDVLSYNSKDQRNVDIEIGAKLEASSSPVIFIIEEKSDFLFMFFSLSCLLLLTNCNSFYYFLDL